MCKDKINQIYYFNKNANEQFQDQFVKMFPELVKSKDDFKKDDININDMTVKNITFVTTESCNLNCSYCYETHKTNRFMSRETAKKAIDALFDKEMMSDYITDYNKCAVIEFIGGEPFLNIDVMEFICKYFLYKATVLNHPWRINYMFNVTTNGTLLQQPRIKRWIEKYKNRLSIGVTIDGNKELHDSCRLFYDGSGSYDIVSKNVKEMVKRGFVKGTKITFAPENIDKINTSIPHLINMGLFQLHANCVFENVWHDKDVNLFYKELIKLADYFIDNDIYKYAFCSIFDDKIGNPIPEEENRNFCGGTGAMLAIGVDGKFFPCIRYMKYSLSNPNSKERPIGDVDNGIKLIKDQPFLLELSKITRRSQSTDECFYCKVGQGCAWCSGFNYDEFGTANKRTTYICKMHKARVLANYYYWNKLYSKLNIDEHFDLNLNTEEINFITNNEPIKYF